MGESKETHCLLLHRCTSKVCLSSEGLDRKWIGRCSRELATSYIQCVSLDSASLIIYPEIKATEVTFSALKRYLCSFYFRIDNETGGIQGNTVYILAAELAEIKDG